MITFKVEKCEVLNFKYNVKVLYNGIYCGCGRFCETLQDVKNFIKNY